MSPTPIWPTRIPAWTISGSAWRTGSDRVSSSPRRQPLARAGLRAERGGGKGERAGRQDEDGAVAAGPVVQQAAQPGAEEAAQPHADRDQAVDASEMDAAVAQRRQR